MNYTIHQLQIFLKVIQTKSITKASEELFMTQPAVSIQLKKFQEQFNVPLTEVVGRNLRITDFGMEIGRIAERALGELEHIKFKTGEYEGLLTGRIKISAASTGKYVIPYFLSDFLSENPGIDLILDVTNKSMVLESLLKNETDFALVSILPQGMNIEEEVLIANKLYLVGNSPERVESKPWIYREQGSATRKVMEEYLAHAESGHRRQLELTSNEAVKQAVMAGLGYSIMPLIGIHNEMDNGQLFIYPVEGLPITTQWRLIWMKGKKLAPACEAYLSYLREHKKQITEEQFGWYGRY
ncbi:MAG: LysR family transcriptional regulator [Bacteroidetes bacterium]|nr:MAG: LysR family transcriptional regulator [Bacteroidota bacterium]